MYIDIHSLEFSLTAALLDHTERRLRFAVTRTSTRIKRVVVRLGDRSAPRGGEDKLCKIGVVLKHAPHGGAVNREKQTRGHHSDDHPGPVSSLLNLSYKRRFDGFDDETELHNSLNLLYIRMESLYMATRNHRILTDC